jgi:glycosyltransferase involved in cell wall biosynthesis
LAGLRILHVLLLHKIGGIDVRLAGYLADPASSVHEHHVLAVRGECHPHLRPCIEGNAAGLYYATHWHGLQLPAWPQALRRRHLARILERARPDLIVVYNLLGHGELWEQLGRPGVPRAYYECSAGWVGSGDRGERRVVAETDCAICNSNASKRILELRWGLAPGVGVIRYGGLRPDVPQEGMPGRELPADRPLRLGAIGRLEAIKCFPLALHALKALRDGGLDCELHIAGRGPEEQVLQALAARLGLANAVTFHGLVLHVEDFYRQVDVCLCPSVFDPIPNVCFEANHFGCPVICTAVDGMPEAIADGETGFCLRPTLDPGRIVALGGSEIRHIEAVYDPATDGLAPPRLVEPELIAAKVRLLAEHPGDYAAMSEAAHARVRDGFRFSDYVAGYTELLGAIQAGGVGRPVRRAQRGSAL